MFGPRSPKGSFGTVSVMSLAEDGCVPSVSAFSVLRFHQWQKSKIFKIIEDARINVSERRYR